MDEIESFFGICGLVVGSIGLKRDLSMRGRRVVAGIEDFTVVVVFFLSISLGEAFIPDCLSVETFVTCFSPTFLWLIERISRSRCHGVETNVSLVFRRPVIMSISSVVLTLPKKSTSPSSVALDVLGVLSS